MTFVSQLSLARGLAVAASTKRRFLPVFGTRSIGKRDMVRNAAMPAITVDPRTYDVRADGELLRCDPLSELPLIQRYALF